MDWLAAENYDVARLILQRGVALVYLIAFANVRNQFTALLGERGLLPVPEFLERRSFAEAPSIFHWRYSDRFATVIAWAGIALSLGALTGVTDSVPLGASMIWWLTLWLLYLSVVNVGQTFYGFGWESLLLEAGFITAFLGNATAAPPLLVLWLFRWLLFRVEFGAGLIKMRGDECWRDLTCLEFHHETQPMPNPASRWFHLLPRWAHRTEVAANHFAQLAAPFLLFLPQPVAGIGAAVMIITQGYLIISGNYAWLNLLTLLLGFAAVPDSWFAVIGVSAPDVAGMPGWFGLSVIVLGLLVAVLSYWPVRNLLSGRQRMNASFNAYHLVNTYGAFGSVTRSRRELILEGTSEPDPGAGDWFRYEFKGKPGDPRRRPRQYAPYHLRLDWLMWFVPLSTAYGRGWLDTLVTRLLEGDERVLELLEWAPAERPLMVRGRLVDYRFSTPEEKRQTGQIWITGAERTLFGPAGLDSLDRVAHRG